MYPDSKSYDVICKYTTITKSMCLPRNGVDMILHQQGDVNQTYPPVAGTDEFLRRDAMCYNCGRTGNYSG